MKLRILHISHPVSIPVKGYGGTERVVYSLANIQAKNGHEVSIMAGSPTNIPCVKDISFTRGGNYKGKKSIIERILSGYSSKALLKSRSSKFDIIHNHISGEAIFISILANHPILTTLHCPITLRKFWPFITTSISSLLPKKTKFVTISRRAYRAYRPFFGKRLINYIHNGLDVSNIPFILRPKKDHDIQIGFLGKIIYEKHPHIAIKIADLIHNWGYDVKLYIMGKLDFPISSYAKKLIRMAKKRKYVVLLPNMNTIDVYRILGNCDIFLNTSFEIGLIMSQLEAMAFGVPVIGFVNGSAEEVVVHSYNGYLGKNLYDISKYCLIALNINRKICRKYVENNFNENKMYNNYLKMYYQLCNEYIGIKKQK